MTLVRRRRQPCNCWEARLIGLDADRAALLVPIAGAPLIAAGMASQLREAVTLLTAACCSCACRLLRRCSPGRGRRAPAGGLPGLALAFEVEPLGMLFALVASGLWIVNSIYSIGYMRGNDEAHQTRFYVCFALALAAAIGIAFAGNLFTLFLFYETADADHLSAGDPPRHTPRPGAAGASTSRILIGTSMVLLLPAMILTWQLAGTTRLPRAESSPARPSRRCRWPCCSRCTCSASARRR